MATNGGLGRKLRMGIVGGGQGSFIGRVHVTAAVLDNRAALVAGAFSSDAARSKASAADYDVPESRAYASYAEMFEKERALPAGERIDFVSVATPNHMHFPVAKAAIEAGFHVVCDKPLTLTLAEAEALAKLVAGSKGVFVVTHNYTGYPLVRQAREMILSGQLGEIQAIRTEYIQGWLRTRLENEGQKQAAWRTDPTKSGAAGCFGDIGTHAYNLGRYMTGLLPEKISANLKIFVPDRPLDDYGHAVIRYENGALGTVTASQISHGRENDVRIQIDGTLGSLEWHQEEPNKMGRLPAALGPPRGLLRGLRQRLPRRLRRDGRGGHRRQPRTQGHDLSEHPRRRGGHVLHRTVGGVEQCRRRLAAVEASPRTPLSRTWPHLTPSISCLTSKASPTGRSCRGCGIRGRISRRRRRSPGIGASCRRRTGRTSFPTRSSCPSRS
jgi:predicted dehydrogenase